MSIRGIIKLGVLLFAVQLAWGGRTMNVQVREAVVRDRPSFMGAIAGSLAYGDQAGVLEEMGAWSRVRSGSLEGWVHTSALTRKTITRPVGGETLEGAASTSEIALAGKGFNQQVEDEFRKQNKEIDFSLIDRMEKMAVSEKEIAGFIEQGKLNPRGGL